MEKFCILPWINLCLDVNGSMRPCCKFAQPYNTNDLQLPFLKDGNLNELWNHPEFQRLRQKFIDGKQPIECMSCWNEEKAGVRSLRQAFLENRKQIDVSDVDITNIVAPSPKALDLKLNNVCNLKCRICSPRASSLYLKEDEQRGINYFESEYWLSNKIFGTDKEQDFLSWLPNIRHIEITGGEPLVSPENITLLKYLKENGYSKNIDLLFNTNAMIWNDKFMSYVKEFNKVNICLSIDDMHKRIEYHRYPSKWKTLEKNVEKYYNFSKENKNIHNLIFCTVSNFNIWYLKDILEWINTHNYHIHFNLLHDNKYNCIVNLPKFIKKIIILKYQDINKLKDVVEFLKNDGENLLEKFLSEVERLDKIRSQSFKDVFPEWYGLLKYA